MPQPTYSWNSYLIRLINFIDAHGQYPTSKNDQELSNWISQQRNKRKKNKLKVEELNKLNEINFIWDMNEWKWNLMYSKLVHYAMENEQEPSKGNSPELEYWYNLQLFHLRHGRLSEDRIQRIKNIRFTDDLKINRWQTIYSDLVQFRSENPKRWPQYDKTNPQSSESKLYIFCQTIRKRFKENDLDEIWLNKMLALDFNFEGRKDNWTKRYEEIKNFIDGKNSISCSAIGQTRYSWIVRHHKLLGNGELSKYQSKKILELNLERFFESWDDVYEKVKKWVNENQKIPTLKQNKDYCSWLYSQRIRFKNGTLNKIQISKLQMLGFDLLGLGKEMNELKWLSQYKEYKQFIKKNKREPSLTYENKLYVWAQSQRAHFAGNLRNRKQMPQNKIDLLNSINFAWVGKKQTSNDLWEEKFNLLCQNIDEEGKLHLRTYVNGIRNPLYTWWNNQKLNFRNDTMTLEQLRKFNEIGIVFQK